ncbi:MAG: hypothetical protein IK990_05360 [Ruminiclostridium sp.]|nr:hypothetical protein [Ruminiclostridium sp.]
MTEIIVIGDPEDTALEQLIRRELSSTYRVLYIKGSEISAAGTGYELAVIDCCSPVITGINAPVIVAKRSAGLPQTLPRSCTAIINSDDPGQLRAAERNGVFTVDCGISPTSTVSFSSETEDTLMVSLNRSLRALSGREIQPLEIPVSKRGADDYTLMSFTALRLLLDDFNSRLGELI